jgi:hypothetical protein
MLKKIDEKVTFLDFLRLPHLPPFEWGRGGG